MLVFDEFIFLFCLLDSIWKAVIDESTGIPYYVNELTGESLWEKPIDFDSSVAQESPRQDSNLWVHFTFRVFFLLFNNSIIY